MSNFEGDMVHYMLSLSINSSIYSVGNIIIKQLFLNNLHKKLAFIKKCVYI